MWQGLTGKERVEWCQEGFCSGDKQLSVKEKQQTTL